MSSLRGAIYTVLHEDATLTGLLSAQDAIYHRVAKPSATPPYIVFHKQSGRVEWAMQKGQLRWPLWIVKAVDRSKSATKAEEIEARFDELLTDAALNIEGFNCLYIRREQDLPEPIQVDEGAILQEIGGLYRIALEPA